MISWLWVKFNPKHFEQLTDLNKLYSVATCWIIIAIQYDARSIENKIIFLLYGRAWQSAALNIAFHLYFRCSETENTSRTPQTPTRIYHNNYMSTNIVICNDHYSLLGVCGHNLVKLYWRFYYVTFLNNIVWKFLRRSQQKYDKFWLYII